MAETLLEIFETTARAHAERPAMARKSGGTWGKTTWREYRDEVRQAARALVATGVAPGQGVVILASNRPEWFVANLAAMAAGARPAGIYTNSTPEQCRYVCEHAEAAVAVVENREALDRLRGTGPRPGGLEAVVLMDGPATEPGTLAWADFLARGEAAHDAEVDRRAGAANAADVATLIYTSGTTGTPKGVMLTQGNLSFIAEKARELLPIVATDRLISYLPLSHVAEQVVSHLLSIATGACVYFAESLEKLPENLREIRPHFFLGVPRVWEKIQAGIQAAGAGAPPLRRRIAAWARRVGLAAGEADQEGRPRPWAYPIAERLVFSKVRARLGFDEARFLSVSAAPIAKETLDFFQSLGLPIMEAYGMSECAGPTTMSLPRRYRLGRAGYAIPGTELKVAEDGEILMRGPHVFKGYYKNEAATRETLDEDGWIHSGDVGEIDPDGFLRVTDRKKELLITSGGKNVAPQHLEGRLKQIPAVSQAVAIGDRRPYVVALLTIDPGRVAAEAEKAGSLARSPEEAARCPVFKAHVERQVEEMNRSLARYETIKKVALLPKELSVEAGELTPTLKLKRRVIQERHRDAIEALYA
ncbi:MAG TPA: AMP-dependent synthetase/ligase [Vicinamibacteria bacterium]|nr:AMP-dependent synthetase/ligase [Vicinamibacteria bacterium]